MRWILADPQNVAEQQYQQHVRSATERWWQAFQSHAVDIDRMFRGKHDFDLVQFMDDHLHAIHPQLMWEFGPARSGQGHRLCITPEAVHWLRPTLRYILGRAPKIPGWEFYAHRLPEEPDNVLAAVKGRVGIDARGAKIDCQITPGRKISLTFALPQSFGDEEQALHAAFVIAECLLGEETLDAWIGGIDIAPRGVDTRRFLPLERAQETVAALARSMYDQLPPDAGYIRSEQTTVHSYQLKPEQADEYPRRDDVLIGSTRRMEVVEAAFRHPLFDSRCHTRFEEKFCYVKLDVSAIPGDRRVEYRAQFEDPLADALLQANVGGVIGGASGIQYSYIDLALVDVMKALPIIRTELASRRAPARSWLLFLDSEFDHEWLGIYPQTPPPPRPTDEEPLS